MSIEVKEKVKPAYIEARYSAYLSWDLESEEIDLDDVKYWDVQGDNFMSNLKMASINI